MTKEEWLTKADEEGGTTKAFEYGLDASDLDDDVDPEFRETVARVYGDWLSYTATVHYRALNEYEA